MLSKLIYKKVYLKSLSNVAQAFFIDSNASRKDGLLLEEKTLKIDHQTFSEIDKKATDLGDSYRGIGVTVGLLGLLIIFCAVAPIGFESGHEVTRIYTILKITMMLLVAYLVWSTIHSDLRSHWIDARKQTEELRYEHLRECINDLKKTPPTANATKNILNLLNIVFKEQILYNELKAKDYHSIERLSDYIGWIGFGIAFIGACAHLFIHKSWLIFPTAFVPALVGTIHGINGFLRLTDLVEDHASTAARLKETQSELNASCENSTKVLELAQAAYQILTTRDTQWAKTAEKLGLKIG